MRSSLDNNLLPLLSTVLSDSNRYAADFRFDKEHSQQLTVLCMYCTIIELAHAEQALIEKGQTTAMPVLLRSIFEAYADLRALIDDHDYYKRMYATFLQEKVRFLRNAERTPNNPFFVGVNAGIDVSGGDFSLGARDCGV